MSNRLEPTRLRISSGTYPYLDHGVGRHDEVVSLPPLTSDTPDRFRQKDFRASRVLAATCGTAKRVPGENQIHQRGNRRFHPDQNIVKRRCSNVIGGPLWEMLPQEKEADCYRPDRLRLTRRVTPPAERSGCASSIRRPREVCGSVQPRPSLTCRSRRLSRC